MTYTELMAQADELKAKAEAVRTNEIAAEVARIKTIMEAYKIKPADLGFNSSPVKTKRAPVLPKYRNPDSGQTWSGRGKRPNWVNSLNGGKTLEDCRI